MPSSKQSKDILPTRDEDEEKLEMIVFFKSYLRYLKRIVETQVCEYDSQNTIFDLKKTSRKISLEHFLQRIISYFKCGIEAYICALCFIDRLLVSQNAKTATIKLTMKNIFKIVSVALLVSTKNFDDFYYTNSYYARVCGLSLQQLNGLEKQFLKMIDFNVFIDGEEFGLYERMIKNYQAIFTDEAMALKGKQNLMENQNRNQAKKINGSQIVINYQNSKEQADTNIEIEVTG